SPSKVHARGIIAITSSLIEYLLAKLLSFQGFIVLFGVGSLSYKYYFNFFSTEVKAFPFDQPLLPIFKKTGLKKGLILCYLQS
ncbi:hypothetical protein J7T62_09960, partial [Lactobacillus delbrueckii subsp. lactis]|nr:hypothetical protein [Lactobacillus delbrueckii subsp. lactis]MCD5583649.1 hypothetical protein [Lactobacillus delbrueckii subsp. lactis]